MRAEAQCPCSDNSTAAVSRVAAEGLAEALPIATYVFVTTPDLPLDDVAQAGGTERAILADLSKPGAMSEALLSVVGQEVAGLPCEYPLPPEYFASVNDPMRVNLTHNAQPVGLVSSPQDCSDAGGWYYDYPEQPQQIRTCPATCEALKLGGSVEILLDCPTVLLI